MANQWLHEFVFWAASLATTETRLQLLPADWFRGSQESKVVEVIDASVGVPWHAKELNMAIDSDCWDPLYMNKIGKLTLELNFRWQIFKPGLIIRGYVFEWRLIWCTLSRCFQESDGFGTHFADGYLEAVESVDRKALFESTMAGQNRLLLRFDPRLNSKKNIAVTRFTRSQRIWAIVQDVAKNGEFSYVTERRQIFVLVRSSVGEEVAEALCVLLECQCSILRLVDLPQDQGLIEEMLIARYQTIIDVNQAVLILPFDLYDFKSQLQYQGTLLDHPHWEAFALMLAHFIADRSAQSLVIHFFLHAQYLDVGDDVALISCSEGQAVMSQRCLDPVMVHAIQYTSEKFLEAGHASRLYYGLLWHHNSVYRSWEVQDFASKDFWGCLTCLPAAARSSSLHIQPMVAYMHVHERPAIDSVNLWHHLLEKRMPPSLIGVNLLVSMPGSGQSYVRFMLELMTGRPTLGVAGWVVSLVVLLMFSSSIFHHIPPKKWEQNGLPWFPMFFRLVLLSLIYNLKFLGWLNPRLRHTTAPRDGVWATAFQRWAWTDLPSRLCGWRIRSSKPRSFLDPGRYEVLGTDWYSRFTEKQTKTTWTWGTGLKMGKLMKLRI